MFYGAVAHALPVSKYSVEVGVINNLVQRPALQRAGARLFLFVWRAFRRCSLGAPLGDFLHLLTMEKKIAVGVYRQLTSSPQLELQDQPLAIVISCPSRDLKLCPTDQRCTLSLKACLVNGCPRPLAAATQQQQQLLLLLLGCCESSSLQLRACWWEESKLLLLLLLFKQQLQIVLLMPVRQQRRLLQLLLPSYTHCSSSSSKFGCSFQGPPWVPQWCGAFGAVFSL
ncbi:hypothetical protein, conserved [Eimeria necatrix]|uniref:Uncharacterized protein n=1 Tax=Eimeria necatrix TaxID=51315 RepID=U6MXB4_9EIME|nr:hypothetical protein, conserved [Eimeria necatrix]CDJ68581.1 hypothetical protein, conserved [Eimeria necatrix]